MVYQLDAQRCVFLKNLMLANERVMSVRMLALRNASPVVHLTKSAWLTMGIMARMS
jgi:hypothetical protein